MKREAGVVETGLEELSLTAMYLERSSDFFGQENEPPRGLLLLKYAYVLVEITDQS